MMMCPLPEEWVRENANNAAPCTCVNKVNFAPYTSFYRSG
jgi:hypothetical protein